MKQLMTSESTNDRYPDVVMGGKSDSTNDRNLSVVISEESDSTNDRYPDVVMGDKRDGTNDQCRNAVIRKKVTARMTMSFYINGWQRDNTIEWHKWNFHHRWRHFSAEWGAMLWRNISHAILNVQAYHNTVNNNFAKKEQSYTMQEITNDRA